MKYEALVQFFGGYFHQDWDLDHPTGEDVLRGFLAESTKSRVQLVQRELAGLMSRDMNEDDLGRMLFTELHCYYDPRPNGLSFRAFLQKIQVSFAEHLESLRERPGNQHVDT